MLLWYMLGGTVVLAVILGLLAGWVSRYYFWTNFWGMAGVVAIFGVFASWVFLPMIASNSETNAWNIEKNYLKAITTDSDQTSDWSFFLIAGGGSSEEEEKYKFIKQNEDGGFFMDEVYISEAVIYEESGKPYMVEKEGYYYDPAIWPWGLSTYDLTSYEFHIPAGSVVETFKIDIND